MRILKKAIWPYKVVLHKEESQISAEIETWLFHEFGIIKGRWNLVKSSSACHFYFKEGKDATLFSLKWL
jgi:hypothetical protein